ncbi:protein S-acyltransferase 18-like [Aristolochia californica]|uniref:protein S-acyltransferase 18-like n=1 Tax=Aristolochia californica TaxID=171875 RepID=UPI0035DC1136
MRRHGWQLPLHPLQIVGMAVYSFLVVTFFAFLGPFLGNRVAENTILSLFSFTAFSVMVLFVRCTAIDPSDKTYLKKKRRKKARGFSKLNYGLILRHIVVRFVRRMEKKILKCFIRRRYVEPWKTNVQMEPLLPFPLVTKDDFVAPDAKDDDIMFCSLCDLEVKINSKHCRSCNRCVEGFDHHCRWLNNCIGKKNYTTFILLMVFILLMLVTEGGTAVAILIHCFADKKGISDEFRQKLYIKFPQGVIATIAVLLTLMTTYGTIALGQLFFFHVVLIKKGMQTYDYILAMKEESQSMELFDDSITSSDESTDVESPEKPTLVSRFICQGQKRDQSTTRLSIRVDGQSDSSISNKKPDFHVSIDPWNLIKMSKEKALQAAARAKERIAKQKLTGDTVPSGPLKPLPSETKCGPLMNPENRNSPIGVNPLVAKGWLTASARRFSSPRKRISGSPTTVTPSPKQIYRSNFDLKLTEVSQELETYISRQALCSVLKNAGEQSPRS